MQSRRVHCQSQLLPCWRAYIQWQSMQFVSPVRAWKRMQEPDMADLSKDARRACAVEEWGCPHDQRTLGDGMRHR